MARKKVILMHDLLQSLQVVTAFATAVKASLSLWRSLHPQKSGNV